MDMRDKYDNTLMLRKSEVISLLAQHYGVAYDDIDLWVDENGEIKCLIGLTEPEREVSFADHY